MPLGWKHVNAQTRNLKLAQQRALELSTPFQKYSHVFRGSAETIASGKDFRRVIELIDSRPDLDHGRIGFYGDSRGAVYGVICTALEPRVKASVLLGGGLPSQTPPAEMDLLNFAPRVHVPTLMVSGRSDFVFPVESAQLPLFRLLGVAAEHKRHALFDGGHLPGQLNDVMREILDWFDRYLGPVTPLPRG